MSSATAMTSRSVTRTSTRRPTSRGVERVVAGIKAQIGIGRRPAAPSAGRCPAPAGQRRHHRALLEQPVDRAAAQRLVRSAALARLVEPGVELELVVELVGEAAAGLKAALHEVLQALDDALGLRVARLAEVPADPQRAAERGERRRSAARRRRAARTGGPRPASRGSAPSDHRQRRIPNSRSGDLLARRPARRRPRASSPRHATTTQPRARLAVPDRDLRPWAPRDRTGRSRRAGRSCAERSCGVHEERPDLAQVVIDDRLAAVEPQAARSARGSAAPASSGRP